jgi:hypothetical protein
MARETKVELRKQYGYCLTCPLVPILLFDIRRSRLNPLRTAKKPLSKQGQAIDGKCIKCRPELDPDRSRSRHTVPPMTSLNSSRSSKSIASASSEESTRSLFSTDSMEPEASQETQPGPTRRTRVPPRIARSVVVVATRDTEEAPTERQVLLRRTVSSEESMPVRGNQTSRRDPELKIVGISQSGKSQQGNAENILRGSASSVESAQDDFSATLEMMIGTGSVEILSEYILSSIAAHRTQIVAQELFLESIGRIFNENRFDTAVFVSMEGDTSVMRTMQQFEESPTIQGLACKALNVLSMLPNNRIELIQDGACNVLQKALCRHLGDTKVVESACATIRVLSTEVQGRVVMTELSIEKTVVEAMMCNAFVATIQRDACAILSNISGEQNSLDAEMVGSAHVSLHIMLYDDSRSQTQNG